MWDNDKSLFVYRALGILSLAMALAFLAVIVLLAPARAEHVATYRSRPVDLDRWFHGERRYEIRRHRKVWRQVDSDKCRPPLAVVGDQYISEKGAQDEADKAWMQTARWQWGERYMARDHADDASYECGRSSVGSAAGQVFYRCRLTAKPCRPGATISDK